MKEAKNGKILLTIDEKGGGRVLVDCTKAQAGAMIYELMKQIRESSRTTYEKIMERLIREDITEDLNEGDKELFDLLFGGD